MQNIVADVLDELAGDFKRVAREPTTGSTESSLLGSLARTFVQRAAILRENVAAAADAEDNRKAAEAATQQPPASDQPPAWDPAEHSVNEVNDHLRDASPEERDRVLQLEASDRPEVPAAKKKRAGILVTGPFGNPANA